MLRWVRQLASLVTILAILTAPARLFSQARGVLTQQQVEQSIQKGVKYLLGARVGDRNWPEYAGRMEIGGVTALVVLALINCGISPDSREVSRALLWLQQLKPQTTYALSLHTMAFCAANPKQYALDIKRCARLLINSQLPNGGWTYERVGEAGINGPSGDPSNSQFALLALHEAQRVGADIDRSEWQRVFNRASEYWTRLQNNDGSFSYDTGGEGTGSMTCAGIASLIIAGTEQDSPEVSAGNDQIRCCGQLDDQRNRVRRGLAWLAANFSVASNPQARSSWHFYYLYALERVGRMTGQRFIGNHDWYREGAAELLGHQDAQFGQFSSHSTFESNEPVINTAMALLFLSKGKRQIVISRLQHGQTEDWNHHARAVQHLTSHTEQAWKRDLAWQTVDLRQATLSDLLETPVLFISGAAFLNFTPAQKQLLHDYVEQGGFIFAEACNQDGCKGEQFDRAFRDFVAEVFEQPLEKLPPDHPIWFAEARVEPQQLPHDFWLYGVQSCCRLGLVYSPISLSCRWELNIPYGVRTNYSNEVQKELDNCTKVGMNVLAYATGKQLKEKLELVSILDDVRETAPSDRGVLVVPKLVHSAGADDAPRAVPTLLRSLYKENPFRMSDQHRMVPIKPAELVKYPIIFMHGRGSLQFSDAERQTLRRYLQYGGFLFVDAICANEEFAQSFRREMGLILPESPLEKLPVEHKMLTTEFNGFDVRQVRVIDPTPDGEKVAMNQRVTSPQLEYAKIEDRIVLVFSPLDLSCALESRHSMQCRGYARDDAARLGINVLLYALQE